MHLTALDAHDFCYQSQKLGGRNLMGSDFEDQSSSPHEPTESALSIREHAPLIDFGNTAAVSSGAPSTPLTEIASSAWGNLMAFAVSY